MKPGRFRSREVTVAVTRWVWKHPEWWMLGLSLCAWVAIAFPGGSLSQTAHHQLPASPGIPPHWNLSHWMLMVVAMMFPSLIAPVRITASRSLWRRRNRAVMLFLAGYLVPWLVFGLSIGLGISALLSRNWLADSAAAFSIIPGFGFVIAVVWQFTPMKRRALVSCHGSVPIAPRGWRANRDCLRYGLTIGRACVGSCWALMLLPMLFAHNLGLMIAVTALGFLERSFSPRGLRAAFSRLSRPAITTPALQPASTR
jgi:predicted metal-binding membrane protein